LAGANEAKKDKRKTGTRANENSSNRRIKHVKRSP
jgi:hypothetical protein